MCKVIQSVTELVANVWSIAVRYCLYQFWCYENVRNSNNH